MAIKKPALSELTKKFDISGIVGGIKSLLTPENETLQVDPSDAIGAKIAQLSLMTQQMAKLHEQLAMDFAAANHLLNDLYKDLEALRHPSESPASTTAPPSDSSTPHSDNSTPPSDSGTPDEPLQK